MRSPSGSSRNGNRAPRPGGSLRACLTGAAVLLCSFLFASNLAAAPYFWILEPVVLPPGRSGTDPVLQLETAAGQVVATSRECQLLEAAGERRICGRIPFERNGVFVLKLLLRDASGSIFTLTLDPHVAVDAGPAFDVVLILDASLSMKKSDPGNLRAEAVKQFHALARNSPRIRTLSLIVFRRKTEVLLPPTPPAAIADVAPYLKELTPADYTDFNAPFLQAAELFAKADGRKRAILFLSDGEPIDTYKDTHRLLDRENCPVYTIGLSAAADAALLARIAQETGGQYFQAQTAEQLRPFFARVFQVIGHSETIVKRLVPVDHTASITFWVDETMHNTILTAVPASGTVRARLDAPPAAGAEVLSDLSVTPVPGLALGRHEYHFGGNGRVSCEITAETGIALQAVALNERGPPDLPLQIACFVRGGEQLQDLRLSCTARDPDDQPVPATVTRTPFGLYSLTCAPTRKPGRYTVSIDAHAVLPTGEIHRETSLAFLRSGDRVPEAAAAPATTLAPVAARASTDGSAALPVTADTRIAPQNGLATTFWASREALAIPALPPGREVTVPVDILLNAAVPGAISVKLEPPAAGELVCRCNGTVIPNQKSPLTLTVYASNRSAGLHYTGALIVWTSSNSWRLPVSVQVDTPVIQANPSPAELRLDGEMLEASQTLELAVAPQGSCELNVSCADPQVVITPATLIAGQVPAKVLLRFRTPPPPARQLFQREVRITGPGLATVVVPFAVELKPVAPRAGPVSAPAGFTLSWPILAVVLVLLIILLVAAICRGNRRAVFVLISLVVHVLVLFLVLPDIRDKQKAGGASSASLSPGDGGAMIVEDRIAPEAGAAAPAQTAPEADATEKTAAALSPAAADAAKPLTPEAAPQAEATTHAANPVEPAKREALTPDALAADAAREAARKRDDTEAAPAERLDPAGDKVAAVRQTTSADRAATVVAPTASLGVAAPAVAQPLASHAAVGRTTVEPQALATTVGLAQPARKQEAPGSAGPAGPAAAQATSGSAATGTMTVRIDTIVEAQALSAGDGSGPPFQLAAAPQATGTELARPALQTADMGPAANSTGAPRKSSAVTAKSGQAAGSALGAIPGTSAPVANIVQPTGAPAGGSLALETGAALTATGTGRPAAGTELRDWTPPPAAVSTGGPALTNLATAIRPAVQRHQEDVTGTGGDARAPSGAVPTVTVAMSSSAPGAGSAPRILPVAAVVTDGASGAAATPTAMAPITVPGAPATLADVHASPSLAAVRPRQTGTQPSGARSAEAIASIPSPVSLSGSGVQSQASGSGKSMAVAAVSGTAVGPSLVALAVPAGIQARQATATTGAAGLLELPSRMTVPGKARQLAGTGLNPGAQAAAVVAPSATRPPPALPAAVPVTTSTAMLPVPEIALTPTTGLKGGGHIPQLPGAPESLASGAGRWRNTFPNLQYVGDWDCDKTAMLNLAHQFEKRTGSTLPFDSRTVNPRQSDLPQAPFMFMSGHTDFAFGPEEIRRLRDYVRNGGFLWINDSTDIGDEAYDRAVRRELSRLFPDQSLARIPMDHPLFQRPYDLSRGFKGYKVPPGDKYRLEYLEAVTLGERLAIIYTRNDYGDGLEIDVRTHPLMASLTDLSPDDMQEGSTEMGINIALYCLNYGRPPATREAPAALKPGSLDANLRAALQGRSQAPLTLFTPLTAWSMPKDWGGQLLPGKTLPVARPDPKAPDALALEFAAPSGHLFKGWSSQAVVGRDCTLPVTRQHVLLLDVNSQLTGGARLALAFKGQNAYAESAPVFFRPGQNRDVIIDLRAKTFKTAESKWQYTASLPEGLAVAQVYLIIMPQQAAGRVELANLRLVKP